MDSQVEPTRILLSVGASRRPSLLGHDPGGVEPVAELRADGGRDFFEELVDTVGVGVAVYGPDGRFEYVNAAYAAMLDTDTDTLEGRPIWDVNSEFDPDRFEQYWESFEAGQTRTAETVHVFGDTEAPVQTVTTRREIGDTTYHFGTIQDISERKADKQRLERQNERLEEFVSIVSHDLRNPLNVANGRLALVREDCDSEHIDAVEHAHDRMESLVDDLLALARQGDAVTDTEPVDIATAVEESWLTVRTGDASLEVSADTVAEADESRLKQLLENLLVNAVEHAGDGVTVTVGDLEEGFFVADDGPGIPEDRREEVFDSGQTTTEDGTGFGLAIVEEVATAHDWTVEVTESADGGARFEVTGVDTA